MTRLMFKRGILFVFVMIVGIAGYAQQHFFSDVRDVLSKNTATDRVIIPDSFRTVSLDKTAFVNFLRTVPSLGAMDKKQRVMLELPMPKGDTAKFHIWESSTMAPGLAAKFPNIKSYTGQGVTDVTATIKIDWTDFGFHAMILSPVTGSVFIDPYSLGNTTLYISYFKKDLKKNHPYKELIPINAGPKTNKNVKANNILAGACRGTELFSYRLAIACTHQYAQAATDLSNPTVAQTLSRISTTINRVNGVYEKEIAVTLVLVATEDKIIFTQAGGDPFTGNNNPYTLIDESQQIIDSAIGTANYDIGHTFGSGEDGLADVGVVCTPNSKARGITGREDPTGDGYDIDFVAHEIGHQFGATHTFNGEGNFCSGNRTGFTAYEPGSGTTIMGYAGICENDDIQPNSDPFFHAISFDQISNYIEDGGCAMVVRNGNTLPQITAMNNNEVSIPLNTPFTLTAQATDADGDAITYNWEQWDTGEQGEWNSGATSTTAPLFKSRIPKTTGSRTFPDMTVILAGYPQNPPNNLGGLKGETLPAVERNIKFRLTIRDNRAGGGGVVSGGDGCQNGFTDIFQINTVSDTGPFTISAPNGGETWGNNTSQTITWNTAGTATAPISCSNVTIQLSTNGGNTYPVTLLANTPNDGSQKVTFPAGTTSNARIRVIAADNIFFDISNNNFSIVGPYITASNGNWNNPSTWQGGVVPTSGVAVFVRHTVNVTANASCNSLSVELPAGNLIVKAGIKLDITH